MQMGPVGFSLLSFRVPVLLLLKCQLQPLEGLEPPDTFQLFGENYSERCQIHLLAFKGTLNRPHREASTE
jgi:hypothetical protein